jgi:hypothetical protein
LLVSRITATKIGPSDHVLVYAKLEQAGKLQLAKLKLFEDVVEVPLVFDDSLINPDRANFVIEKHACVKTNKYQNQVKE